MNPVPIRANGRYKLYQQSLEWLIPLGGELTASEALQRLAIEQEYLTDGCKGVRITRRGNVTTVHATYHLPVSLWAELA